MFTVYKLKNYHYGGGLVDIPLLVNEKTFKPLNVVCGFLITQVLAKGSSKSNTHDSYASKLKEFFEVLEENSLEWHEVTDSHMSSYLYGYLFKKKGNKGNSIQAHIAVLKKFYDWAYYSGLTFHPKSFTYGYELDGFLDYLHTKDSGSSLVAQYIEKDDFLAILSKVHIGRKKPSLYVCQRDEIVLMLGYYCGLRAAEVVDKRNLNTKLLREKIRSAKENSEMTLKISIVGKGNKPREIIIPPKLFFKIDIFLNGKRKSLPIGPLIATTFGKPIKNSKHASDLFTDTLAYCDEYKGENINFIHFHSLRHTFATNLVSWCHNEGKDYRVIVPERMGHTDEKTTDDYIWYEAVKYKRSHVLEKLSSKKIRNKRYYSYTSRNE